MAGVIVVTTKKGKQGQAHISYTGEFTSRLVPSYSNFDILDSKEQMGIYRELADKGWLNFLRKYSMVASMVYMERCTS